MASLQKEPTGVFHIIFRFGRKRFKRSLETKTQSIALARLEEIEDTVRLLQEGRIQVPEDVAADGFILAAGRIEAIKAPQSAQTSVEERPKGLTLKRLFEEFFSSLPDDNLESNTLRTMHTHEGHFLRLLKPKFAVDALTGHDLQKYVNARSKECTQYERLDPGMLKATKRKVSGTTIKKEIATLGTVWRWAATVPLIDGNFPNRGLRYPKAEDKPPFQTFTEITQQIKSQNLVGTQAVELWECLYLKKEELVELLTEVESRSYLPKCAYPMIATAAFTGARRSELIRSELGDINFNSKILTLREKKRVRGRRSSRRVPLSSKLEMILRTWLEAHPGGQSLFCDVAGKFLSPDKAQDIFGSAFANSKWTVIRGWHTLRHSFISNLACDGIDQRLIDDFVGHTTEDMRRRYRHLFPEVKRSAILKVFG